MTTAFSPGHITCFFSPVRTGDMLSTGSVGAGIKTSLGSTVVLEERSDRKILVRMDGRDAECNVTRSIIEKIAPSRGFDVTITNGLPVGQGFGMSAAGALAAGLCACEIVGKDVDEAYRAAHISEIEGGGGLGDVSAILCGSHVPVRTVAGLPPIGKVIDSGLKLDLNVAVLGEPLNTGKILGNADVVKAISEIGPASVEEFAGYPTVRKLFELSKVFSEDTGLETPIITDALSKLWLRGFAGMCMLGHSIFTNVPKDIVADEIGVDVIPCTSTDELPHIIRKG